jgi:hypothetical protein
MVVNSKEEEEEEEGQFQVQFGSLFFAVLK